MEFGFLIVLLVGVLVVGLVDYLIDKYGLEEDWTMDYLEEY